MDEEVNKAINRYCAHFFRQIERVQEITGDSADLFKKILFSSVLDALSRSVFPKQKPRDRFTSLVRVFGEWPEHKRVSLPHLVRLLQKHPSVPCDELRAFTKTRLSEWNDPSNGIGLDQDPILDEVLIYVPKSDDRKAIISEETVQKLTHLQLLYSHRCVIFHELRTPGYGIDIGFDNKPYYHELHSVDDDGQLAEKETFEMVYPVRFFQNLCMVILTNLQSHLQHNKINPVRSYRFGSYWIEDLN